MRFFFTAKLHVLSRHGNTFLLCFFILVFGIEALQASMRFQNEVLNGFVYSLIVKAKIHFVCDLFQQPPVSFAELPSWDRFLVNVFVTDVYRRHLLIVLLFFCSRLGGVVVWVDF